MLNEKRTDWIVYIPGEKDIYDSIFDAINKTLALTKIQPHSENKKIFTFRLSKRIHLGSMLKKFKKKSDSTNRRIKYYSPFGINRCHRIKCKINKRARSHGKTLIRKLP